MFNVVSYILQFNQLMISHYDSTVVLTITIINFESHMFPLSLHAACPSGLFGRNCLQTCTCNEDEECNKMTGFCNCSAGFMGSTCHQTCPGGTYGLSCASQCQCFTTGTRSCHHINGSCDCLDSWTGELCEVEGITQVMFYP
jgi:hypothetical protein